MGVFTNVVEAFECAVSSVLEGEDPQSQKWKVEGPTNFNALVRLCIKNIKGFCVRFLQASNNETLAEKRFDHKPMEMLQKCQKKWLRLKKKLSIYMGALVQVH